MGRVLTLILVSLLWWLTLSADTLPIRAATASADDGNVPQNAIDGNPNTRWSCPIPSGGSCWLQLDLAGVKSLTAVNIAWYQGQLRTNTFRITTSTDGTSFMDVWGGTSTISTSPFQRYSFPATPARFIRIYVTDNSLHNSWSSINEVQAEGSTITCGSLVITAITASSNDGNLPQNAIDGNLNTRWSGQGIGANITADLSTPQGICGVSIAWYRGDTRRNYFTISSSNDDAAYQTIFTGTSSGTTAGFESYKFTPTVARYIRITVNGNSINDWASINELQIGNGSTYDSTVLADRPVAFWDVNPRTFTEPDLSGNGHDGHYINGLPNAVQLPNFELAADFDGLTQYLTIQSSPSFSVSTTHDLTFELWFRADIPDMPKQAPDGHVQIMGKCDYDGPRCEWEARHYNATTTEGRRYRGGAYIFNIAGGEGSSADWQPVSGELQPLTWHHMVGEFTTNTTPSDCANPTPYPGSIEIWIDGIKWNAAAHRDTGCMSQFKVTPQATGSPVNIGTMAYEYFFKGAVGKVAIYDYLLTPAQITQHFEAMTVRQPTGNCNQPKGECTLK